MWNDSVDNIWSFAAVFYARPIIMNIAIDLEIY